MFHLFASKESQLLRQSEKGNIRKVTRLLSKGANVNTRDEDGCTPLCSAVFCNHQEVAETLIAAGADVNVRLRDESVLMQAAWNGWHSTVEQLIAAEADVNAASNSGTTALINAAAQGHAKIVRSLITAGADVHIRNWERGALCAAIYHHHPEAAQILLAAGATLNLAEAADCGDMERVRQLLAEGVSPDEDAAITRAAYSNHVDIVRLLLESGANVNATDALDNTALHHAVHWGRTGIVRLLLDAGADATIDNINGHETPLILAVLMGRTDCVRLLLEKRDCSKEINKRIEGITTLLHMAVESGHTEIVRLLLQHGADVNIKRRLFNDTPLDIAIREKREEIASLLRPTTTHAPVHAPQSRRRRGCALTLALLYLLQCLAASAALWHKHDTRTIDGVQLTLYYPTYECVTMYTPGIGTLWVMMHWLSWGKEMELVKALDIQLPDGRLYTLHSEDYQQLEQLGIRQTPQGVQLTDDCGQNYVDTPLIPYADFQP